MSNMNRLAARQANKAESAMYLFCLSVCVEGRGVVQVGWLQERWRGRPSKPIRNSMSLALKNSHH